MSRRLSLLPILMFAAATTVACPGNECSYDEMKAEIPQTTIDCGSSDLCYLGQCFRGCNPGSERLESCVSNDDCKQSERPNCVFADAIAGSYCSTCEEGETCVLGLNICQPVAEIPDPEEPTPMNSNVPLPLDGGQIDGSSFEDAGSDVPMAVDVAFTGIVSLVQSFDVINDRDVAEGNVSLCDTRTTSVAAPLAVISSLQTCELRQNKRYFNRPPQIDLGTVRFAEVSEEAMTVETVTAQFDAMVRQYRFQPPLPDLLFNYSIPPPSNHEYVEFSGGGATGLAAPWTSTANGLLLIPYEFIPQSETQMLFDESPIEVSLGTPLDLTFGWELLPAEIRDSDLGFTILVEIGGARSPCDNTGADLERYTLRCAVTESDLEGDPLITVPADLLAEWMMNIDAQEGQTVTVRFGRVRGETMLFYNDQATLSSLVDLHFGREFKSQIVFVAP